MLAFEANNVIALRLSKMAFGGPEARSEAKLMVTEKIDAAVEASCSLLKRTSRRLSLVIVNTCRQMPIVSL
jgi:hypothetical protein